MATSVSDIARLDPSHVVYIETTKEEIAKRWTENACKDDPILMNAVTAMAIRVFPDHDEVWLTFDEDWLADDACYFEIEPYRRPPQPDPAQIRMPESYPSMTVGELMEQLQALLDAGTVNQDTEVVAHGPTISTYWEVESKIKYSRREEAVLIMIG